MFNYMPNTSVIFESRVKRMEVRQAQSRMWLKTGFVIDNQHAGSNPKRFDFTSPSAFARKNPSRANEKREWLYSVTVLGAADQSEALKPGKAYYEPNIYVGKRCYICNDPYCPNIDWVVPRSERGFSVTNKNEQQRFTQSLGHNPDLAICKLNNRPSSEANSARYWYAHFEENCKDIKNNRASSNPHSVSFNTNLINTDNFKSNFTHNNNRACNGNNKFTKSFGGEPRKYPRNSTPLKIAREENFNARFYNFARNDQADCVNFDASFDDTSFESALRSWDVVNSDEFLSFEASLDKPCDSKRCDCVCHSHSLQTHVNPTMSLHPTLSRASDSKVSGVTSYVSVGENDAGVFVNICNTFWRPRLSFNPFKFGDKTLTFSSLWPEEKQLKQLVMDAFEGTELRRHVLDLCKLALHCGPVRLLKSILELKIIGIDQVFEDGSGMLHLACIARNYDVVLYLCSTGVSPKIRDKFGHSADQVCFCPKLRKILPTRYIISGSVVYKSNKTPLPPSQQDIISIFQLAESPRDFDELLKKLQTFDFDINRERDNMGDYLLHVAVNEGISQMPLVLTLVTSLSADINLYNSRGMTPLMIVAFNGDAILCDLCLMQVLICLCGANPNLPNSHTKQTALHYACFSNSSETVSALIKRGACFNLEDCHGRRADDTCVYEGSEVCREIIESERKQRARDLSRLVKEGHLFPSDIRVTDLFVCDDKHRTLIMVAAAYNRVENLKTLLDIEGAPIDAQHVKTGATALAIATIAQSKEAVTMLLTHGANPAIHGINGYVPLHYTVMEEAEEIVEVLLQFFPSTYTNLKTALSLCRSSSMEYKISKAISRRQEEIVLPELFDCALTGDDQRLFDVLEDGDVINPKQGINPLLLAVENGHLDVVKLLYERGGDICCRHPTTRGTVLHAASRLGHVQMMQFLLQFCRPPNIRVNGGQGGSDSHYKELNVNEVTTDGKTCLQLAAEKGAGYMKIVRMLLDQGATAAILDENGYLFSSPDFEGIRMLIQTYREAHTDLIMKCIVDKNRAGLTRLKQHWQAPYDHHLRSKEGDTPLMIACKFGRVNTVKFLLRSAVYKSKRLQRSDTTESRKTDDSAISAPVSDDVFYDSLSHVTPSLSKRTTSISNLALSQVAVYDSETTDDRVISSSTPAYYLPSESEETGKQLAFKKFMDDVHLPHGLYIYQVGRVCHVNAVNLTDGSTALHRAVEGGDDPTIILLLLRCDSTSINHQNSAGLSPLHLAAKLGRRRILEKLVSRKDVDVHLQTNNQEDVEDLTTNKTIKKLIAKAKHLNPVNGSYKTSDSRRDWRKELGKSVASTANDQSTSSTLGTIIDFDKIGEQFKILKKKYQQSGN